MLLSKRKGIQDYRHGCTILQNSVQSYSYSSYTFEYTLFYIYILLFVRGAAAPGEEGRQVSFNIL